MVAWRSKQGGVLWIRRIFDGLRIVVSLLMVGALAVVGYWYFDASRPVLLLDSFDPIKDSAIPGGFWAVQYTAKKRKFCSGIGDVFAINEQGEQYQLRSFGVSWPPSKTLVKRTAYYRVPELAKTGLYSLRIVLTYNCNPFFQHMQKLPLIPVEIAEDADGRQGLDRPSSNGLGLSRRIVGWSDSVGAQSALRRTAKDMDRVLG